MRLPQFGRIGRIGPSRGLLDTTMNARTIRNHSRSLRRSALGLVLLAAACAAQGLAPVPNGSVRSATDPALTTAERWSLLVRNNFFSTGAVFRVVGPSTAAHLFDSPEEWDGTIGGYGKRLRTQAAMATTRGLITSGSAAALGHDPRYQRCDCAGTWRRTGHALSGLILAADAQGARRFDPTPLFAAYGGAYAGASLYPDRYSRAVKGYQLGTRQLAFSFGQNLFLEFTPEIKALTRKLLRR